MASTWIVARPVAVNPIKVAPDHAKCSVHDVRTLVRVAMQARERKIVKRGLAAVLACDHMIDAKGFVGRRSNLAVLASGSGPLTDLPANFAIHELRDFNATRAFDCRTARKFAMCR